ncbi:MAG: primosomal protein N' [Pseudomonadota bacterium]|nr:primosomal protein N' [Pseudomonadota bacterium]
MSNLIKVVLNLPIYQTFDYIAPKNLDLDMSGVRVEVMFGRKKMLGIVVPSSINTDNKKVKKKYELKEILKIIDKKPIINKDIMNMCLWASNYYQYPLGQILFSSIPSILRKGGDVEAKESITYTFSVTSKVNSEYFKNKPSQRKIFDYVKKNKKVFLDDIKKITTNLDPLQKLINQKLIKRIEFKPEKESILSTIDLNKEQLSIYKNITSNIDGFGSYLVEGATGSGKTELYIKISELITSKKGQVLIMVPEINLTPQTLERFQRYLGFNVKSYHSSLTESERLNTWLGSQNGDIDIIIGTRSSIFLPFKNLKVIIIDEEHDASLKQQEKFKYHARDLSLIRGQSNNFPVVLGSATPSFESLHNCKIGKYNHLELSKKFFKTLPPKIILVDLNKDIPDDGFSSELKKQIKNQLKKQEQTLLFIGRRGFSHTLLCKSCGWLSKCSKCDAYMAYHSNEKKLWCHHCGHKEYFYGKNACCKESEIIPLGFGTERIEKKLKSLFPSAKIMRIDSDSINTNRKIKDFVEQTKAGSIDILVGTQMLVKGHDFPKVSLVGIMDIDPGLHSIDFRGTERTAQLMVQVAGRSGRHKTQGQVIIQTRKPDHQLITELLKYGYRNFSKRALLEREEALLPPYSFIALLKISSHKINLCQNFLQTLKDNFGDNKNINIYGPIPAPMIKKNNMYHFQLMIKSLNRKLLLQKSQEIREYIVGKRLNNIRWSLDIDPLDVY